MDRRLRDCFGKAVDELGAGKIGAGVALVAVGGYGRAELSPSSDVDVVLVHPSDAEAGLVDELAQRIWYPLWDDGLDLDHAVRTDAQMIDTAEADLRAALGMLDARAVAGDPSAVVSLRSRVLAAWRRDARRRLPELEAAWRDRVDRVGWLAQSAIMDLKESGGGLRDGVVMRALVATWLVDVPHRELEALRGAMLDVRDVLHTVTGRRTDRLTPELIGDVATEMGFAPDQLDHHVRDLGRRTAHLASTTWRRLDDALAESPKRRRRHGPRFDEIAPGVAVLDDEVVLTGSADPATDALVALRASSEAARRGLVLSPPSAARLAHGAVPGQPWPAEARRLLVQLLTSGRGLVAVWEELDLAGVIDLWLPEWSPIRLRGSTSPVHQWTIDRHSIETCVNATALMRNVARPDLLAVAAVLHDIGKGVPGDHSEVGAPIAERVASRWGFGVDDAALVARLVRLHLLLPTVATRRDIEDPDTIASVVERVGDLETLDLLAALSECDARATGPSAWTTWRAGLIRGLVAKVRAALEGRERGLDLDEDTDEDSDDYAGWPAAEPQPDGDLAGAPFVLATREHHDGHLVRISAPDRPGLLADLAGALTLAGRQIRSARSTVAAGVATSIWEVPGPDLDESRLTTRIRQVLAADVSLESRLGLTEASGGVAPQVLHHRRSSTSATVIEVRADDRRGLVWTLCSCVTAAGHQIRSAHLSTFGPQARDVLYVVDADGAPLTETEATALVDRLAALPL